MVTIGKHCEHCKISNDYKVGAVIIITTGRAVVTGKAIKEGKLVDDVKMITMQQQS